ncbi:spore coat protein CotD [Cytobacillus oceanisediminis]|uniref:Spore coat protein CotD n=1 Tax=Niallia alba TaxID=2729105 RepID=A0A7Y0K9V6_9BACI|nr:MULTISPECIES: CotD family spore coat protein [Bacillaceae]MBQ6446595.1 spore coat protein CotD [Bacillus sp. (in: firmicutes)]MBZ9536991.1 spore coat protein CotD [Cytobacillus oceanisediminis]NMO78208.1 spore coat protein CotD [Niallia alba]UTI41489.1 spore coat protein [Niallia sp. RD1]
MHCKPNNILPAVVHPTKCCVNSTYSNNIVPHIHPTHTTTVNHVNYEHQHYFPHTQSAETVVTNTQANMGPAPAPYPVAPVAPAYPTTGGIPFTATGQLFPGQPGTPGMPGAFPFRKK